MKSLTRISLYGSSGILMGIGFIVPMLWPLGFLGVALNIGLLISNKEYQVCGSYLAWFVKSLFAIGYFLTVYPIRWLPYEFSNLELGLVILYWLTVSLFLAFGGAAFGLLYKLVHKIIAHSSWFQYIAIPLFWVGSEIVSSISFSIFTLGPGSSVNTHYNAGYIGLLSADHHSLLQLAHFGGVYALSFITALASVFIVVCILKTKKLSRIVSPAILILILFATQSVVLVQSKSQNLTATVAAVNTKFPVAELFDRGQLLQLVEKQEAALAAAVATEADYILLPEDSRFFNQANDVQQLKNYFKFKHPNSKAVIVDSGRVSYNDQSILQGFVFDSQTGKHKIAHKKYLVPQGEFVPYFYESLFKLIGFDDILYDITEIISYTVGPKTSQVDFAQHYPGLLFCFESSSATGVRKLVKERSIPFVAHPISHAWFNEPQSLWNQLERSLKIQAVWNDVSIVSASNHAPSQMFLPDGSIEEPEIVATGEFWEVGLFKVPLDNKHDSKFKKLQYK